MVSLSMNPLLEVQKLQVDFHKKGIILPAIRNINLTIDPGETVCIVARSYQLVSKAVTIYQG